MTVERNGLSITGSPSKCSNICNDGRDLGAPEKSLKIVSTLRRFILSCSAMKISLIVLVCAAQSCFAMIPPAAQMGRHLRNLPPVTSPAWGFHIWNVEKLFAPGLPTHPNLIAPGLPTHPMTVA